MDESSFDIDATQVAETSARFPSHRLAPRHAKRDVDVSHLRSTPTAEHARHVWDEAGTL